MNFIIYPLVLKAIVHTFYQLAQYKGLYETVFIHEAKKTPSISCCYCPHLLRVLLLFWVGLHIICALHEHS